MVIPKSEDFSNNALTPLTPILKHFDNFMFSKDHFMKFMIIRILYKKRRVYTWVLHLDYKFWETYSEEWSKMVVLGKEIMVFLWV